VDTLIEEAVQIMNTEMGKYLDGDLLQTVDPSAAVGQ
jgi:hypothetical protein